MAHNGGTGPPPPPLRLGPAAHTARLLPHAHTHNVHSNVLLPAIHSSTAALLPPPTSTASPHRLRHAQFLHLGSGASSAPAESRNNNNVITLDQPRPGVARVRNEYIETPLRTQLPSPTHSTSHKGSSGLSHKADQLNDDSRTAHTTSLADVHSLSYNRDHYHNPPPPHPQYHHRQPLNHLLLQPGPPHQDGRPQTLQSPSQHTQRLSQQQQHNTQLSAKQAIDTQPCSTLKKNIHNRDNLSACAEDVKDDSVGGSVTPSGHDESIICPECGRCRCGACRSSRPLPSTWICSDSYQCSAETTLDYCTCMCCVKAAFYHCCKDYEIDSREVSCADKPCSCSPHHRWMRWGCLCVLSAALPCLLCYLPMRACLKGFEACHSRCSNRGCRCPTTPPTSTNTSRFNSPVGSDVDEDVKNLKKKLQAPPHSKRLLDPNV